MSVSKNRGTLFSLYIPVCERRYKFPKRLLPAQWESSPRCTAVERIGYRDALACCYTGEESHASPSPAYPHIRCTPPRRIESSSGFGVALQTCPHLDRETLSRNAIGRSHRERVTWDVTGDRGGGETRARGERSKEHPPPLSVGRDISLITVHATR